MNSKKLRPLVLENKGRFANINDEEENADHGAHGGKRA